MNIAFSEDQILLKDQVRKLLEGECDSAVVREVLDGTVEYSTGLWKSLCDMGLPGTAIPEEYGGAGAGYLELCVVAEELGRAVAPVPFASSVYLAAEVLKAAGSQAQKETYLPRVASGEAIGTVALDAAADFEGGKLSGTLNDIPDGGVADLAVVLTSPGGGGEAGLAVVDLCDASVTRTNLKTIDPTRNLANLSFDNTPAEALECSGGVAAVVERARNHAAILLAYEQVGGAEKALEMAIGYAHERYAFGRPIGSFQAIKHMLANMYVEKELARSNCYYGAWALSSDAPELAEAAATARVSATLAYQLCAKNNIQTHGGIGFTWESDCHLYYRRSNWLALVLGTQHEWKDKLAGILIDSVA